MASVEFCEPPARQVFEMAIPDPLPMVIDIPYPRPLALSSDDSSRPITVRCRRFRLNVERRRYEWEGWVER